MKLHSLRHFILYAKGHYVQGDFKEDLCKLIADYSGLKVEHVKFYDAWEIMNETVYDICKEKSWKFFDFIKMSAPENNWEYSGVKSRDFFGHKLDGYDDEDYWTRIIRSCLSKLKFIQVYSNGVQLINLGYPDSNILEISEGGQKRIEEDSNGN